MHIPYLTRLFTGVILAIAVPGIACFGWYSMESVGDANATVRTMVIVAYPAVLIALIFLVLALASSKRSRFQVWVSAVSLIVALVVVFFARI